MTTSAGRPTLLATRAGWYPWNARTTRIPGTPVEIACSTKPQADRMSLISDPGINASRVLREVWMWTGLTDGTQSANPLPNDWERDCHDLRPQHQDRTVDPVRRLRQPRVRAGRDPQCRLGARRRHGRPLRAQPHARPPDRRVPAQGQPDPDRLPPDDRGPRPVGSARSISSCCSAGARSTSRSPSSSATCSPPSASSAAPETSVVLPARAAPWQLAS